MEAGKLVVQKAPFSLKESCDQVFDLYRLTSDQCGVALNCEIDQAIPEFLEGDSIRVQQVLTNLIGNAFKFTPTGHIDYSAYLLPASTPELSWILFTVSDTGKGIPEDKLSTLFESFTQVSGGYTRQHQGAGLGLAICRQLVGLMGGSIAVDSEEGAGTAIYFSLPFEVSAKRPPVRPDPPVDRKPRAHGSLRILLAEDERVNSLVTRRLLEKEGHVVTVVENGREAIDAVRENRFDVILMDIQMPVMDGVSATRAIRAGEAGEEAAQNPHRGRDRLCHGRGQGKVPGSGHGRLRGQARGTGKARRIPGLHLTGVGRPAGSRHAPARTAPYLASDSHVAQCVHGGLFSRDIYSIIPIR